MIIIGNTDYCFMTSGKIGTSSLLEVSIFSDGGKYGDTISESAFNDDGKYRVYHDIYHGHFSNAKKIVVIREPLERFLSGVMQVISFEQPINLHQIRNIVGRENMSVIQFEAILLDSHFWYNVATTFLENCFVTSYQPYAPSAKIQASLRTQEEYHFGNWLMFPHFCKTLDPETEIVNLSNLSNYGDSIGLTINKVNDSNNGLKLGITKMQEIKEVFKEVVMNLPVWHNKIKYYLEPEMILYNELMMIENANPIDLLNQFNKRPK